MDKDTPKKTIEKTPAKLAVEHWSWLESVLSKIYCDAFIHGYKHGEESNKDTRC